MKKIFNSIIAVIIIATTALGNTAHAQDEKPVETGLVDFATLKQREPRLLSPDEQAKLYPSLEESKAAYEAFSKTKEAQQSSDAWQVEHDRRHKAIEALEIKPAPIAEPALNPIDPPKTKGQGSGKALYKPAVYQGGSPRNINVIVLHYVTQSAGVPEFPATVQSAIDGLNAGTKFQGSGTQALNYNRIATYTVNGGAPTLTFPQTGVYNTGLYTNFMDIATIYNTYNLCAQFAAGTVDQVWIYSDGFSAPNQVEFAVNGSDWNVYSGFTNVPKCGKAGVFFSFIYTNFYGGTPSYWYPAIPYQALHSYGHYVEALMSYRKQWDYAVCDAVDGAGRALSSIDGDTAFAGAYCPSRPMSWTRGFTAHPNSSNGNVGMCGDVHFPPNITSLTNSTVYSYTSPTVVNSICNNWNWAGSPTPVAISCSTWSTDCTDINTTKYQYFVWWFQRIPSKTTNATDRWGATRGSFWDNVPTRIPQSDVITRNDYNGDKKTDLVIWRPNNGYFYVQYSELATQVFSPYPCPTSNVIPRTGRYLTGAAYFMVYETTTGNYDLSSTGNCNTFSTVSANQRVGSAKFSYTNQPLASDAWRYDPSTGVWAIVYASGASGPFPASFTMGGAGYDPVIADFDGDGIMDPAVYNKSTGAWNIYPSATLSAYSLTWGAGATFVPQPGDVDGDKKAEVIVYDTASGTWYVKTLSVLGVAATIAFGSAANNDIPVAADYDGDGYMNYGVYRPASGVWYYLKRDGSVSAQSWGGFGGDVPLSGKTW